MELLENNAIAGVTMDTNQSEKLLRVLDTVVIKLEGGTDEDILALDEKPVEAVPAASETAKADDEATKGKPEDAEEGKPKEADLDKAPNGNGAGKKRKRSASGSSDSSSSSSDSDSDSNDNKEKAPVPVEVAEAGESVEEEAVIAPTEKDVDEAPEEESKPTAAEVEAGEDEEMAEEKAKDEEKGADAEPEVVDLDKAEVAGPRALHKTSSIFLRNLAPTITKAEVEAVCRRYDGYLRVAIADPLVDRRWFRRGWVSFRRDVNIKEICWNLNNIRVSRPLAIITS